MIPLNLLSKIAVSSFIILLLIGLIIGFWFDTQHTLVRARTLCKQTCATLHLQLLDDTVALTQMRFRRNSRGTFVFQRTYTFEVTERGGNSRHIGTLVIRGKMLEMIAIPGYLQRTISPV